MGDDNNDQDLAIKDFWLIVYFKESYPEKQFEILHQSKLLKSSWETLERGANVTVMFGSCRSVGRVVHVSDDHVYLKKNFETIKEEFLKQYCEQNDRKPPKKMVVPTKKKAYYISKPEVIKIADKDTQTDENEYLEMHGKYEALKLKYLVLEETLAALRGGIEEALDKTTTRTTRRKRSYSTSTPSSSSSETSRSPKCRKDDIFLPCALRPKRGKMQGRNILSPIENNLTETIDEDSGIVYIGSSRTEISRVDFEAINWTNYSSATRKLLMAIFDRKTLATHSLTGKPSPAFLGSDKLAKMRLDPAKIGDIVETVSKHCEVSQSLVRSAITTKCADENKMYKKRLEKGKENTPNGSKSKKLILH